MFVGKWQYLFFLSTKGIQTSDVCIFSLKNHCNTEWLTLCTKKHLFTQLWCIQTMLTR